MNMHFYDMLIIAVNCIVVYFFVVIAIRIFGKKELAQLSVIDLVFILLISNSVQNAMVGSNSTLWGGLSAALTLFIVNYLLKKLMYKNERVSEFLQGRELLLIYKGKVYDDNLRKAEISYNELHAAIREHGVQSTDGVDLAMLEADGNISVVSHDFSNRTLQTVSQKRKHSWKQRFG